MVINMQAAADSTGSLPTGEYDLFLARLLKAPIDERGTDFVRKALSGQNLLAHIDEKSLLQVAITAQQHGLIKEAVGVFEYIHTNFPNCENGWRQHLEMLSMLGEREKMVQVMARGTACIGTALAGAGIDHNHESITGELAGEEDVTAPFQELREEEEQVKLFMRVFRGKEEAFARQWVNRQEEKQGYVPVHRPIQPVDIREHLDGRKTYGIYLLNEESMVYTGVIDLDLISRLRNPQENSRHKNAIRREAIYLHKQIITMAKDAGLDCLAELSGGKGFHFWFPVKEPVPAAVMRSAIGQLVGRLKDDMECYTMEIFPKQDRLTGKGFGNLVKLPLGIHRGSGKPSCFVLAADSSRKSQFELLSMLNPNEPETLINLANKHRMGEIVVHPRHAARAKDFPNMVKLESNCSMLARITTSVRSTGKMSVREEKILLGTLGHLQDARPALHNIFSCLPEYNRALLDYKITKVRGTVLGCKRIHSLLESPGELHCRFNGDGYPHPLRHLDGFDQVDEAKSEKVENLKDALVCLKTAIRQVERFI